MARATIPIAVQARTSLLRLVRVPAKTVTVNRCLHCREQFRHDITKCPHCDVIGFRPEMQTEPGYWGLWTHTTDFQYGTLVKLYDTGLAERVTIRRDEGDDITRIKKEDAS